jgi:hypothetical protein
LEDCYFFRRRNPTSATCVLDTGIRGLWGLGKTLWDGIEIGNSMAFFESP